MKKLSASSDSTKEPSQNPFSRPSKKPIEIRVATSEECQFCNMIKIDPIKFKTLTRCLQSCYQIQLDFQSDLKLKKCELVIKPSNQIEFAILLENMVNESLLAQLIRLIEFYEYTRLKSVIVEFDAYLTQNKEFYDCLKYEKALNSLLISIYQSSKVVNLQVCQLL